MAPPPPPPPEAAAPDDAADGAADPPEFEHAAKAIAAMLVSAIPRPRVLSFKAVPPLPMTTLAHHAEPSRPVGDGPRGLDRRPTWPGEQRWERRPTRSGAARGRCSARRPRRRRDAGRSA